MKSGCELVERNNIQVTLRARVWVEMLETTFGNEIVVVTLRARVWVEIEPGIHWEYLRQSPSVRGRRLK